jgi:hypothetical protein
MMTMATGETRLRDVCTAFGRLADSNKGLRSIKHLVPPDLTTCSMLLVAEEHGAQVRLDICVIGANVVARSGLASVLVGSAQIEDRLTTNLTNGFDWDGASFDSSDEMAYILFKHMRRRLAAAADLRSTEDGGIH